MALIERGSGEMGERRSSVLVILIALGAMCCSNMEGKMSHEGTGFSQGGPCTYTSYEGRAEIVRITQTRASMAQSKVVGGAGYEGCEVWFRFVPKLDTHDSRVGSLIGREHLFTLHNGWYVGPRYLEKYGIQPGREYPCILKLIEKGACSPVVFEFETIDSRDYFESRP
jgi:hypothetical protein